MITFNSDYFFVGLCLACNEKREFGGQIEHYLTIGGKDTNVQDRIDHYLATGQVHELVCHT